MFVLKLSKVFIMSEGTTLSHIVCSAGQVYKYGIFPPPKFSSKIYLVIWLKVLRPVIPAYCPVEAVAREVLKGAFEIIHYPNWFRYDEVLNGAFDIIHYPNWLKLAMCRYYKKVLPPSNIHRKNPSTKGMHQPQIRFGSS